MNCQPCLEMAPLTKKERAATREFVYECERCGMKGPCLDEMLTHERSCKAKKKSKMLDWWNDAAWEEAELEAEWALHESVA